MDLTGQRFGKLTVVADTGERVRKYAMWLCRCDCGNEIVAQGARLRAQYPRSCGCVRSEEQSARAKKRPYESLFNSIGARTNKFNLGNTLTYEEFLEIIKQPECHYCGNAVSWSAHRKEKSGGGQYNLDRKDSSIGYTKENCVVCCWDCNRMKFTHTYTDFLERVRRIAARRTV